MGMLTLNKRLVFSHGSIWVLFFHHCHFTCSTENIPWQEVLHDCYKELLENHFCWSTTYCRGLTVHSLSALASSLSPVIAEVQHELSEVTSAAGWAWTHPWTWMSYSYSLVNGDACSLGKEKLRSTKGLFFSAQMERDSLYLFLWPLRQTYWFLVRF